MNKTPPTPHRHVLYEAAVQSFDFELDLFTKAWKKNSTRVPLRLREDFCGTAAMAAHWAASRPNRLAWGVDLDDATLRWGLENRIKPLGDAATRVRLLRQNVLDPFAEQVDIICALNFSYWIFHDRDTLLRYFKSVRKGLADDGMFMLDVYGGPLAMETLEEKKKIPAGEDPTGVPHPAFTYFWQQETFDHLSHRTRCNIHFQLKGKPRMERAFTYDWRQWTPPELTDLLREAGLGKIDCWAEGWDSKAGAPNGRMLPRKKYAGMQAFILYLAARPG